MQSKLVVMVDAGFLREAGRATLNRERSEITVQIEQIVGWGKISARRIEHKFVRLYWYDALYPDGRPELDSQKEALDKIEQCPGTQLRLGKLVDRPTPWRRSVTKALRAIGADVDAFNKNFEDKKSFEQKGVDTLIVLDMLYLAQRSAYDSLLLLAGDTDLAEAVRAVQGEGKRVILGVPKDTSGAPELRKLADEVVTMSEDTLKHMLL